MSARFWGAGIATVCGIAIAYTTLQPELEKQQAERNGEFREEHANNDRVISQAIMSDLKEAKQQVEGDSKGFAWGIREAIFGSPKNSQPSSTVRNTDTQKDRAQKSGDA